MSKSPIICFGQQPCGFFSKNFLAAKINTAKKLQRDIGGSIVFFYHDSDADYRETITILKDKMTGAEVRLNFTQENKLQKKYSPLYLKRIPSNWKTEILKQLPRFVNQPTINIFQSVNKKMVADFCLKMYKKMELLDGIEIIRSSDKNFREKAIDIKDGFIDVEYQNEIVRAKMELINLPRTTATPSTLNAQRLLLHKGGGKYTKIPIPDKIEKVQISAGKDERFGWMQSVIGCTHYIYGEGEKGYLKFDENPNVNFIERDKIQNPNLAFLPNS